MTRYSRMTVRPLALASFLLLSAGSVAARNEILGELRFVGATKVERTSGVWVNGLYVGYLEELKGSKKVLLLPGEHRIAVRQIGYFDFERTVNVEPGEKKIVFVSMQKDERARPPEETAEVKLSVWPRRAAVFVDDYFVGPVSGLGKAMLLSPGKHRIKIALPGFQTFETEISLLPNQKFELKTSLHPGSVQEAGPLMRTERAAKQGPQED